MPEKLLLDIRDIHKSFGMNAVLKGISLKLGEGEVLALIGGNGAGKSTLMKGLLGLIKPTGGVLTMADELKRSGIGYLPQQTPAQKDFPATVQAAPLHVLGSFRYSALPSGTNSGTSAPLSFPPSCATM